MGLIVKDYNTKFCIGQGWIEAVESHGAPIKKGRGGGPRGIRGQGSPESRKISIAKTKTMLRRRSMQLWGRSKKLWMWTLTFRENLTDYAKAVYYMHRFLRRARWYCESKLKKKLEYVAVSERQERGAWHFHLLVNVDIPHSNLERLWRNGFVWVERIESVEKVRSYISKYFTKFQDHEFGKKRYWVSRGLTYTVVYALLDKIGQSVDLAKASYQGFLKVVLVLYNEVEKFLWWFGYLGCLLTILLPVLYSTQGP